MKQQRVTLLTLCLVTVMMVMAIMPHHHHGRRLCAVMEVCQQDHVVNDVHTGHHSDGRRRDCQFRQLAQMTVRTLSIGHQWYNQSCVHGSLLLGSRTEVPCPVCSVCRKRCCGHHPLRILNVRSQPLLRAPPSSFIL